MDAFGTDFERVSIVPCKYFILFNRMCIAIVAKFL